MANPKKISVFEHQRIKIGDVIDGYAISEHIIHSLQVHHGQAGVPYYTLTHLGIKFNEFVGVLQIGNTTIEVLPKIDKFHENDKNYWQRFLIDMLLKAGIFEVLAPSNSSLKLKANSILDLYIELFINEVEYLQRCGLIKKYKKKEANLPTIKGKLLFTKNIIQNHSRQDRNFVEFQCYSPEHKLHQIIFKTIRLLSSISTNYSLKSKIGVISLNFPEMPDIYINHGTFETIKYNRKSMAYKCAIDIAKLLLLKFHPDILSGRSDVLALMFDMNILWERYVFQKIKKENKNLKVSAQQSMIFWQDIQNNKSNIRPDIVIEKGSDQCKVYDTKWKTPEGKPSSSDLQQMYVYQDQFKAVEVGLIYPGVVSAVAEGRFSVRSAEERICRIITHNIENATANIFT